MDNKVFKTNISLKISIFITIEYLSLSPGCHTKELLCTFLSMASQLITLWPLPVTYCIEVQHTRPKTKMAPKYVSNNQYPLHTINNAAF